MECKKIGTSSWVVIQTALSGYCSDLETIVNFYSCLSQMIARQEVVLESPRLSDRLPVVD